MPLLFDFDLFDNNILIEADGEGHYISRTSTMTDEDALNQLEVVKYHDNIKTTYCENNNIHLIRIPYWEKDNLEKYILDNINKIAS